MAPITTAIAISACLISPFALGQSDPLTEAANQAGLGAAPGADPGGGLGSASLNPSGSDSALMDGLAPGSAGTSSEATVLPGLDDGDSDGASASAECTGSECEGDNENDAQETDDRRTTKTQSTGQCGATGDIDKDGVCDDRDDCLNTPEGAATLPNGCHLDRKAPLLLEGVRFEVASARLAEESRAALERAVALLKTNPQLLVTVDGYTDNNGSRDKNQRLSVERAETVYRYFLAQGIDAERLAYRGFGERQPRAPNTFPDGRDYPAGRAQNRRVELSVLPPEQFADIRAQNAERERARRLAREAEEQRRREALEAERQAQVQREKSEQAQEEYKEVLEFLEQSGAAETKGDDTGDTDNADQEATDDGDYSLEVTEPEL